MHAYLQVAGFLVVMILRMDLRRKVIDEVLVQIDEGVLQISDHEEHDLMEG